MLRDGKLDGKERAGEILAGCVFPRPRYAPRIRITLCAQRIIYHEHRLPAQNHQEEHRRQNFPAPAASCASPRRVPRSFLQPGLRIKLHPDDTYPYDLNRGGIDERWFASPTPTANKAARGTKV
jgi:hypothetical protein